MSYRRLQAGIAATLFLSTALLSTSALAAKDTLVMGVALEPPHLDPTAGAAAAIVPADQAAARGLAARVHRRVRRGGVGGASVRHG